MSASCLQRSAAAVRLGLCSAEEQAWSRQLFSAPCCKTSGLSRFETGDLTGVCQPCG